MTRAAAGRLTAAVPGAARQTTMSRSPWAMLPMVAVGLLGSVNTVLESIYTVSVAPSANVGGTFGWRWLTVSEMLVVGAPLAATPSAR